MINIVPLPKEIYQGYPINVAYLTDQFLRVTAEDAADAFLFRLEPACYPEPVWKGFSATLYPPYWENAEAFGVLSLDKPVAVIELVHETWNNRLRVTELWVDDAWRHRGIGSALLDFAKERMRTIGTRMLVLETQSCNHPAIRLYRKNGFCFIGVDTHCYTNADLEADEVRLEMGFIPEGNAR